MTMLRSAASVRAALAILAGCAFALVGAGTSQAYGWPLKPFNQQHAIRGGFDDPRLHLATDPVESSSAFHFGIDISADDWAPVYAVGSGKVSIHPGSVVLRRPNGRVFGYWHVVGIVNTGTHVREHQLLGYVLPGWGHVHFAESRNGLYVNPLRRGALAPYHDNTKPVVASVRFTDANGTPVASDNVSGTVGVVADIYDTPPLAPPAPWQVARLTPALVRWRLLRGPLVVSNWRTAADFTDVLTPSALFDFTFAPGTYQNKANRPGCYIFWITRTLDLAPLPPGGYEVQVEASDTRSNVTLGSLGFSITEPAAASAAQSGGRDTPAGSSG
jgi:murein DD-endopeptidase MepM/ murein hydrolase activator NlpD